MWNGHLACVCVAGFGVALLSGCGNSPSTTTPTASGGRAPSSTSVGSISTAPASVAQLKEIVLQAADFPTGWKNTHHTEAASSVGTKQRELSKCVGVRDTHSDKVDEAHSEDFTLGNASIYSSAISFRSQRDIDDNVAMLRSPKLANCFAQLKWFGQSGSFKITPGSASGPANVVATATGNVQVGEQGLVTFYVSAAYITGPLIQADVSAVSAGTPVPESVLRLLVAAVATRAAKG